MLLSVPSFYSVEQATSVGVIIGRAINIINNKHSAFRQISLNGEWSNFGIRFNDGCQLALGFYFWLMILGYYQELNVKAMMEQREAGEKDDGQFHD